MFTPHERSPELNALLDAVAEALADLGVHATQDDAAGDEPGTDLRLMVDAGARGRRTYPTVVRLGRLDRQRATALPLPAERPLLLLAPHLPDAVAEVLRARDVDYADAAGNVRLAWDGLLIDTRGRRPATSAARAADGADRTAARAFTRAGTAVVMGLLSWPDLPSRPVREIATVTGTAVGTVHTVLHELTTAGYLRDGTGGRALHRGGELLGRWAEAYTVTLARHLPLASFTLPHPERLPDLTSDLLDAGAQLGGELAASRIDAHLQPSTATFYLEQVPAPIVARYRLRPDQAGSVRFRRRFWQPLDTADQLVPAPLVYADLVSSGDPRQREHAERIRAVDDRLVELDHT